jgi:hypothetical protein
MPLSTIFQSYQSVLLVEETRVPGENHWTATSYWQTLSHNVVSSTPRHETSKSVYSTLSTRQCLMTFNKQQTYIYATTDCGILYNFFIFIQKQHFCVHIMVWQCHRCFQSVDTMLFHNKLIFILLIFLKF